MRDLIEPEGRSGRDAHSAALHRTFGEFALVFGLLAREALRSVALDLRLRLGECR